jgi:glutathione S-transferase
MILQIIHNTKFTQQSSHRKTSKMSLTVYYWPMAGRAGAVLRMLEHAGISYVHKSEFPDLASVCSAFGAGADTFAPPVVVDGDLTISQSTACAVYIGQKCNLVPPEGVNVAKAFQFIGDIVDFYENGLGAARGKGGAELKKFLEGDRFRAFASHLERSIQGPFYFGDAPCYVDFFLCASHDWACGTCLDRLKAEKDVDVFAPFVKINGVIDGIRNLESYKSSSIQICRDDFKCKDELIEQYV